ncbi:MAG TPA: CoA ester lyase [Novosphingobium sp.]|nr:CoA ester lyase [Novosphingobium sp.]
MSGFVTPVAPLFVPADRPERFAKAAASGADAVILDLEDAVAPDRKAMARAALACDFTEKPVIVRINGVGTPWHREDVAAVAGLPFAAIMLPKAERAQEVAALAASMPVIALVETARGIAAVREIAQDGGALALTLGTVDYVADLGCEHTREALLAARSEIVLASRLGGLGPPIDGVTLDVRSGGSALDDARHARALGFGGKLAIHPAQVAPILQGMAPAPRECEWARRVLDSGDGAVALDGMMIDEPVRARARAILRRAAAIGRG